MTMRLDAPVSRPGPELSVARTARVLVAVAVPIYREALATALAAEAGIAVVGMPRDLGELIEQRRTEPDLALVDDRFVQAVGTTETLRAAVAPAGVVSLVGRDSDPDALALARAGVSGLVTYDDSVADLAATLAAAARGDTVCSPGAAALLLRRVIAADDAPTGAVGLTAREAEVVGLLDEGLSNKEIAVRLAIELPTVKHHVHNILQKLGVARRGQAVAQLRGAARSSPPSPQA